MQESAMILTDPQLHELFKRARTIAVVGMSPNEARPSHYVAQYMREHGYTIFPVNPLHDEIAGIRCYPDLASVPQPIDIVNVFRRAEYTPTIAREAVAIGAKCLWLQLGIVNAQAASIAHAVGMGVVMDACIKVEHARLLEPDKN